MAGIPPLNSEVLSAVEKLAAKPEVRAAFAEAERDVDRAMREQIELCEIEAPTFHEENRAKRVAELMRTYGLKDVVIDPIGNVVGRRPGRGNGPVLALGAHMDSVFPAGTDVKVRQEGRIYHAPGIGLDCVHCCRSFVCMRTTILKPRVTCFSSALLVKKATVTFADPRRFLTDHGILMALLLSIPLMSAVF